MGMFNTTNYKSETVVTPITQVIEKTISPDKVTEMYDKVKDEVLNSVLRSYTIETNSFRCAVLEYIDLLENRNTKYRAMFQLNGKEYVLDGQINQEDKLTQTQYSLVEELRGRYAELISLELIKETAQQHHKMTNTNTP